MGHLIKLLVAEPQCGSDVPRLRAVHDQALHSTVERCPGNVGFVLGMDQPLLGLPGLGQPLLIHLAHSSEVLRHNSDDSGLQTIRGARSVPPSGQKLPAMAVSHAGALGYVGR